MTVYLPSDASTTAGLLVVVLTSLGMGYGLARMPASHYASLAAWALALVAVGSVVGLSRTQPPGARMLAIIATLLTAMKAVVVVVPQNHGAIRRARQWLWFASWPGMNPREFGNVSTEALSNAGAFTRHGLRCIVAGALLVGVARWLWTTTASRLLATPPLLVGLSLGLHFGLFNVATGFWRARGVDVDALFVAPLRATSLREFWGHRWNLAFSQMTAAAVYRPLGSRLGKANALAAAFLFSGLLHELAISVPAGGGYGGPFLYFVLHGVLMRGERWLAAHARAIDSRPWIGRIWTLLWLTIPLPLLFHRPFLAAVIWPLIGMEPTGS